MRTFRFVLVLCALNFPMRMQAESVDPAEIAVGERLFLETRFAHHFFAHGAKPDPVMAETATVAASLPGPFVGQSMNCMACHLVDQQAGTPGGGMRTYADFARRSPLSAREDGKVSATRNSPSLVNIMLKPAGGTLLHFDGEFKTLTGLIGATFSGRMLGWLPDERAQAIAHIASVIRNDDGSGDLAQQFGGAYPVVLAGASPELPPHLRLPRRFRLDVATASDQQIFAAVVKLTAAYVRSLEFARDSQGRFKLSPYDRFLKINEIPRLPANGETPLDYSKRLLKHIERLDTPRFVGANARMFRLHEQAFAFGRQELAGLKLFLTRPRVTVSSREAVGERAGNCVTCHPAPNFTDFGFHNTGTAQKEYDSIHGEGTFRQLLIPSLDERLAEPDRFLPASAQHPQALEPFRAIPATDKPGHTDLGLWNVFANPDLPGPQRRLTRMLCGGERRRSAPATTDRDACSPHVLLPQTIALFKTPGLRDMGHSAPYMHTGQFDTLEAVVNFYQEAAALTRAGQVRNGAPELARINLSALDIANVVAFLRSLNEDYE